MKRRSTRRGALLLTSLALPLAESVHRHVERVANGEHDAEDVHGLRVGTRRLELAVVWASGVRGKRSRRMLETLAQLRSRAGRLRDCDVAANLVAEVTKDGGAAQINAAQALKDFLEGRRRKANRRLVQTAQGKSARRVERDMPKLVDGAAMGPGSVQRRLNQAMAAALKLAAKGVDEPEQLHLVRIAIKRVRYAAEFAAPLLGAPASALERRARRAADYIGRAMDIHMLIELIAAFVEKHPSRQAVVSPLEKRLVKLWVRERNRAVRELSRFCQKDSLAIRVGTTP